MTTHSIPTGVIGTGTISGIYLKNAPHFTSMDIVACADVLPERAQVRAQEYGIAAKTVAELLADPEIQLVINLTIPRAHAEVAQAVIAAGKSVYNEKPLAVTREDGRATLEAASARGVRVGCAPDTFLGASLQTCRELLDAGAIGEPVAATAFMLGHGPEHWHPDPAFYYQVGGGPMFDMGPYYLTALISLLGPVRRVTGSARISFPERTITSEPKYGEKVQVEIPTHIAGVMDFASGAIGTIVTSFDVWSAQVPRIEIYGTTGTLSVPDPNRFGDPVRIRIGREDEWRDVPLTHANAENSRGLGAADLAQALISGRPHRASGELAYHVLDIMHAFHDASREGRHIELTSTCERPAPLPPGLPEWVLDE
ncbi:MAG TPA: Gfo/Idh/MocA family oxidoreductase [Thermomicrobiales bacterium]|nr:Gfo/Idh/MocA family oxidoreductase [Thermomicrobiales bacterium]